MKKSSNKVPETDATAEKVTPPQNEGNDSFLRPFLFLGVMPLMMMAIIIWSGGDLLEDLAGQRFEPIRKEFKKTAQEMQNDD